MNTKATKAVSWKTLDTASFIASRGGIDPFKLIGTDWTLVSAGGAEDWNGLTASWGGLGRLWNRDVAVCYIRPSRHTFGYIDRSERFTLSFFGSGHRKLLDLFGSKSGRTLDKAAASGAVPVALESDAVSFAQANFALVCRTLYAQELDPGLFRDPSIAANYPQGDYHTMYVGQIESVRVNERPLGLD